MSATVNAAADTITCENSDLHLYGTGATLSDVTARKEYGVTRDFIVQGIEEGKLEYRERAL